MAGQGKTANFRGAAVQNVKKNALTLFNPDGFAMAEHPAVNGKELVANFVPVRHPLGQGSFHGNFTGFHESSINHGRRKKILRHVAAAAESRFEFFQNKKDFAIVAAWIFLLLDVNRPNLAAVLPRCKIGPGAIVRMIEAQTGRIRRERDAALAMCRDVRRSFLGSAIDVGRDFLAMPMQLFRRIGLIQDVHRHLLTFFKANERPGELAIVGDGGKNLMRRNLDKSRLDAQGVVGGRFGFSSQEIFWRQQKRPGGQPAGLEELASRLNESFH